MLYLYTHITHKQNEIRRHENFKKTTMSDIFWARFSIVNEQKFTIEQLLNDFESNLFFFFWSSVLFLCCGMSRQWCAVIHQVFVWCCCCLIFEISTWTGHTILWGEKNRTLWLQILFALRGMCMCFMRWIWEKARDRACVCVCWFCFFVNIRLFTSIQFGHLRMNIFLCIFHTHPLRCFLILSFFSSFVWPVHYCRVCVCVFEKRGEKIPHFFLLSGSITSG